MKFITLLCLLVLINNAVAETQVFAVNNIALGGVDVVAYFTEQTPTLGKQRFSTQWRGVNWQFANQQHLSQFKSNPLRYAPQFGGFCSLTTAHGASIPSNPKAWAIHNERLYLFVFESARDTWLMNPNQLIERAESQWLAAINN